MRLLLRGRSCRRSKEPENNCKLSRLEGLFRLFTFVLLLIVWAPRAIYTGDNSEKEEGGGGPHQEPDEHGEPLHVLLHDLVLLSAAVLVSVWATAEDIPILTTRGTVEPSVPLSKQVYVARTVLRTKDG